MYPIFMKFGTQNKSNMLIINILLGTDELDPKLQISEICSQNRNCASIFMKFNTGQIENANYE